LVERCERVVGGELDGSFYLSAKSTTTIEQRTDRLGTSIRIGAVMPRYSLVKPSCFTILRKQSRTPVYPSAPTTLPCWSCIRVFTTSSGYLSTFSASCSQSSMSSENSHHQNLPQFVSQICQPLQMRYKRKSPYFRYARHCPSTKLIPKWQRLLLTNSRCHIQSLFPRSGQLNEQQAIPSPIVRKAI
jgi:hypothetical protein